MAGQLLSVSVSKNLGSERQLRAESRGSPPSSGKCWQEACICGLSGGTDIQSRRPSGTCPSSHPCHSPLHPSLDLSMPHFHPETCLHLAPTLRITIREAGLPSGGTFLPGAVPGGRGSGCGARGTPRTPGTICQRCPIPSSRTGPSALGFVSVESKSPPLSQT